MENGQKSYTDSDKLFSCFISFIQFEIISKSEPEGVK